MNKDAFKQLDKAQDTVHNYLKNVPTCRDSTTYLYYLVLSEYYRATSVKKCDEDDFLSDLYDLLHYAPCDETIQRSRRKVQNTYHQFKPTKKVQEIRETRQSDFSDWATS